MSLDDKPAKSIMCRCSLCKGNEFVLLGPAPEGVLANRVVPASECRFTAIECTTCGEVIAITTTGLVLR